MQTGAELVRMTAERAVVGRFSFVKRRSPPLVALCYLGDSAVESPDEVQVEFGLLLSAEAGAVLAAASATANYKVTMTWKRQPK